MSCLDLITDWVEKARLARYDANELAKLCRVSPSQLRRYFALVFGKPPQKWLDELRQLRAARLLVSGFSVKEVEFQLHFKDEGHFYHQFKDHHGCTPMEFLLRYRQEERERINQFRVSLGKNFDSALLPPSPLEVLETNHCRKIGTARFGKNAQNARPRQ